MAAVRHTSVLSKFKGALVGALVGDCFGAFFECKPVASTEYILEFVSNKMEITRNTCKPMQFTDDTAMTRSVARSLISSKQLCARDMAERFASEFRLEPGRGYGGSVGEVFSALFDEDFCDPHGPASKAFGGEGSYGNGGAMRIAPAALFCYNMSHTQLDDMTRDITKITHSNRNAINGAILQCAAVEEALKADNTSLTDDVLIHKLLNRMEQVESFQDDSSDHPYCEKLRQILLYTAAKDDPTLEDFEEKIGTGIEALEAVPAAIYSFVRCLKPVKSIPNLNPFERTIIHSISLGGDTDTIATMSGAIAGAYYGIEMIQAEWQRSCEDVKEALDSADKLYNLVTQD